jgi:hypothetical protein
MQLSVWMIVGLVRDDMRVVVGRQDIDSLKAGKRTDRVALSISTNTHGCIVPKGLAD